MAGIWKDIEIGWQGKVYTVKPTLAFLNYLESRDGMSLSKMLMRLFNQDLPSGVACDLIARTLQYADPDCRVTAEDVFAETGGVGVDAVTLAGQIITACLPAPKHGSSAPAPATGSKKKARTGGKSTV